MLKSSWQSLDQHPTDEQLQAIACGHELDPTLAESLENHLTICDECQSRIDQLPLDSLQQLIRKSSTASSTSPKLSEGYELIEEIGRGAAGIVYRAKQTAMGRTVALKMMVSGAKSKPAELARFRRESEALGRLDHPHIVKIFDVGEQDGVPFLAMEWIAGTTLSERLSETAVAPQQAAKIVSQLAGAMSHAHENGVLHRDLKPQNVLVSAADDGPLDSETSPRSDSGNVFDSVKICDFGLARFAQGEGFQTQDGETLGTPSYMAPEQIASDSQTIDESTDIYGLGAILYECLTGRPPFHGNTPVETVKLVLEREPVAISELRPNVPRDLHLICHRCLAKQRRARFASARELQDDLERFLDGRPILSRPVSKLEKTLRWCKRNPWPVSVAMVAIVAAISIIVAQMNYQHRLADQRDEAIKNYQTARSTIWGMLDSAELESDFEIPRLQQLQTKQTQTALELFESLAEEEGTEESLIDLGRIQMKYGSGLVAHGEIERGQAMLDQSQQTFQRLVRLSPENTEIMSNFISSQVKVGHLLIHSGKWEEAVTVLRSTLPLAQRLHRQVPSKAGYANLVAWTHHNLGAAFVKGGDRQQAALEYEHALRIRRAAMDMDPNNDDLLRLLAESQISLGVCQMGLGDPAAADSYLAAIETLHEIQKRDPQDGNALVSTAVAYLNYSNIQAAKEEFEQAIDACTKGIEMIERVVGVNPTRHDAKSYLSMLYGNRGLFRAHADQHELAVDDWERGVHHSVDQATRDQCRYLLVHGRIKLCRFESAIDELTKFEIRGDDPAANFYLATTWSTTLNELVSANEKNEALENQCVTQIKRVLGSLDAVGFLAQDEEARNAILAGDEFSGLREKVGIDELLRIAKGLASSRSAAELDDESDQ